jgi:putative inorganic carbon (HCO3(-)) transporter
MQRGQRWTWIAWLLLAAATPFLLFPGGWRTLALVILPVILVGNRVAMGCFFRRTPYDMAIALLLLMVLVSLYATFDVEFSLPKITGTLLGVTTLYVLVNFAYSLSRFELAVLGLQVVMIAFTGFLLVGTQWGGKVPMLQQLGSMIPQIIKGLPGAEEGFHPNEAGGALTWLVFLPLTTGLGVWRQRRSAFTAITACILLGVSAAMAGVLLLTQSRSAWIGTIVGIGALAFVTGRWGKVLVALGLIAALATVLVIGPAQARQIWEEGSPEALSAISNISLEGRIEIWSRALYGIQDFPFTGMGMGTFRRVVPVLYPLFLVSPDQDIGHAHNEWLQVGVDLGIPGLVAYLAIQALGLTLAYKTFRSAGPPLIRWTAGGTLAGLIAHGVYGLTDAVTLGAKPGIWYWILLGLAAASWELVTAKPDHPSALG